MAIRKGFTTGPGVGSCFHLPGFHLEYICLTHSHMTIYDGVCACVCVFNCTFSRSYSSHILPQYADSNYMMLNSDAFSFCICSWDVGCDRRAFCSIAVRQHMLSSPPSNCIPFSLLRVARVPSRSLTQQESEESPLKEEFPLFVKPYCGRMKCCIALKP